MTRFLMMTLAAGIAIAPLSASAQDVYVYPETFYGYGDADVVAPAYGPQVYGYYQEYVPPLPSVSVRVPTVRNGCGQYHYWDGRRCVDARFVPPDID